ncbi:MAG: ribonuclease PH [Thermoleophilia bacterium]|nr:ribonuclease PH [Thermoleophilia bacterium]
MAVERPDGRTPTQLRPMIMTPGFLEYADGSVLIEAGKTKVICAAKIQDGVPNWMRGKGNGWVTAEYSLLPSSTPDRTFREAVKGKQGGRTLEIQRLVGRSLRSVVDMRALGERTIWLDCDVIQADGGTRCASVSGAYVALYLALASLVDRDLITEIPLKDSLAAVSVGIWQGEPLLDLDYAEDSTAETDMNVVMTGSGGIVELQATAEKEPFSREALDQLIDLAASGIELITAEQLKATAVRSS